MKEITVISGKGGTGKTSLVGCFAALSPGNVITDCDVDAANLSLIMSPTLEETRDFSASKEAFINKDRCSNCGLCRELCRYDAITGEYQVDSHACEGCGVCYRACPEEAISFEATISGQWFLSKTPYGSLVHARLGIAEENSGKLVTQVRNKAKEIARDNNVELIINDAPPGIGCPVIASLGGADAALIVVEPTLSGIHDMERVMAVCRHFNLPALVCINRFDLDEENSKRIRDYCQANNILVAGQIPLDKVVVEAMVQGVPVTEYSNNDVTTSIKETWEKLLNYL